MAWTAPLFDRLWDRYDSWYERHPLVAESELRAVRAALSGLPGPCVEVGVGTGWFASRAGCEYGVDPSRAMLRIALERGVLVAQGRGERLPLATGSMGSVLMVVTLCFVSDPLQALREARRVLAPGGGLAACIVPADSDWGRHYARLARQGHPFYAHARFLTVGETERLMRLAGLEPEGRVAVLRYPPWEPERLEEPTEYRGGEGFVCIRGRAVTGLERAEPLRSGGR